MTTHDDELRYHQAFVDAKRLLWRKWNGKEDPEFERLDRYLLFDAWAEAIGHLDDEAPGFIDEERDEFIPGWNEEEPGR
jgi:hypothetical protein